MSLTYGLESGNLLIAIAIEVELGVVDSHASLDTRDKIGIGILLDTLVGAVTVLEVQDGSPIVREVLCKDASGARSMVAYVQSRLNSRVEHIASNNLMKMG